MQVCFVQVFLHHRFPLLPFSCSNNCMRFLRSTAAHVTISPHYTSRERCYCVQMVCSTSATISCESGYAYLSAIALPSVCVSGVLPNAQKLLHRINSTNYHAVMLWSVTVFVGAAGTAPLYNIHVLFLHTISPDQDPYLFTPAVPQ